MRNVKVGDSSRRRWKRETEKDREKRERRDIRSILRRHERRRSIAVDTVPSSTRCSRPSIGWKQRITRRENRLTRLAIDPTGNLSRPSLLTRRANKGEIPRPFRGIKYLGAIYLLRSFLSTLSPPFALSSSFFSYPYLRRRPDFTAEKRSSLPKRRWIQSIWNFFTRIVIDYIIISFSIFSKVFGELWVWTSFMRQYRIDAVIITLLKSTS